MLENNMKIIKRKTAKRINDQNRMFKCMLGNSSSSR